MERGQSDAEAIAESLRDPASFEVVFDRHYDAVRRYLQHRCGLDAGEELTAQTFLVAFDRRACFDGRSPSAKPWLMGIATNVLRHHRRAERTRLQAYARVPVEASRAEPDEDALAASMAAPMLSRALAETSRRDRDALLLMVIGELSYEEIASALHIPVGTVRSRIHRARMALRERLPGLQAIWGVSEVPPIG
ncbi:MAG: RNA polymerase sigma factor [Actinomycetota bacterium]